jgi:hypothetical protein
MSASPLGDVGPLLRAVQLALSHMAANWRSTAL